MKTKPTYRAFATKFSVYPLIPAVLTAITVWSIATAEPEKPAAALRSRVYRLRHITSQQFQALLEQLQIGKEYNALSGDVLIVTSDKPLDLHQATSLAAAADTKAGAVIKVVLEASEDVPLPEADKFAASISDATVGTLLQGPPLGSPKPAIVDVRDNKLIAVGGAEAIAVIEKAAQAWQTKQAEKTAAAARAEAEKERLEKEKEASQQPAPPTPPAEKLAGQPPSAATVETDTTPPAAPAAPAPALTPAEKSAAEPAAEPPLPTAEEKKEAQPAMPVDKTALPTEEFISAELVEELEQQRAVKQTPIEPAAPFTPQPPVKSLSFEQEQLAQQQVLQEEQQAQLQAQQEEQQARQEEQEAQQQLREALKKLLAPPADQPTPTPTRQEHPTELAPTPLQPVEPALTPLPAEPTTPQPATTDQPLTLDEKLAEEELELTLTLPEEVELEAMIELVGKTLKLNYLYDPATIRGQKVTVRVHDGKIKVRDIYALLESALRFRGFVMTRRGNLVTIARRDEGMVDPALRSPDDPIQPGDVVVSNVFHLKHITPAAAQNLLAQMKLGAEFSSVAETGTLIVTDYAFRMARIRQVIEMLDQPGTLKTFQYRQLRYMQASELAPKVQALAQQLQNLTVSVTATTQPTAARIDPRTRQPIPAQPGQPPQPVPPQPMPPTGVAGESGRPTAYLEADDRTNRLLMIATPSDMKVLNELIDALDVPGYNLRTIKEYVIQNVEASEVILVLNQLGIAQVSLTGQDMLPGAYGMRGQMRQQVVQPGQPQQPMPQPMPAIGAAEATTINQPFIALRQATNSLLVNATQEQHKAIEMVIQFVDVKQKDQRTIREYEIQYVDTQTILDTLAELGIISKRKTEKDSATGGMTAMAGRNLTPQQQQLMMMQQQQMMAETGEMTFTLPTAEGTEREITAAQPQIAVLPTTNSLLVHATPRQHQAIALVIAHADRQLEQMAAPYMVYALENQDPEELAEVLNKLIQETLEQAAGTQPSAPDAKIQTKPLPSGIVKLPSGEEQRIRIIPDPKTYSLVVYASRRNQQWIGELIRELDQYRPQVLLDCTLVEISKDDKFEYDLDLIAKTYGGATLRSNAVNPPLVGNRMDFTTSQFLDARSKSGQGIVFFDSSKVQGLLKLMERRGYGRIMARPKLLVNDNQEGEIKAEETVAVPQERTNVQVPPTGGTPVTTTDITFTDYTAGVTLKIKPHISKGNMLRLEITLNRTDFKNTDKTKILPSGQVPVPPDRLSSDITTTATIPDGSTIILGGLEKVNQSKTNTKVPILGDVPLLGGLFRNIDNADRQNRLYVFVKANIIRPSDQAAGLLDMRRISMRNRQNFEELEQRFQKLQSWPGINDPTIDPDRVLEDDEETLETLRQELDALDAKNQLNAIRR